MVPQLGEVLKASVRVAKGKCALSIVYSHLRVTHKKFNSPVANFIFRFNQFYSMLIVISPNFTKIAEWHLWACCGIVYWANKNTFSKIESKSIHFIQKYMRNCPLQTDHVSICLSRSYVIRKLYMAPLFLCTTCSHDKCARIIWWECIRNIFALDKKNEKDLYYLT